MNPSETAIRIVVLDDEPLVLAGIAMMLRALGHTVTEVTAGEDLVDLMKNGERFNVAILDLSIPNGSGALDIISELLTIDASMKTVVSSGFGSDDVISNCSTYGFSGSLAKPFTMNDLTLLIDGLLSA